MKNVNSDNFLNYLFEKNLNNNIIEKNKIYKYFNNKKIPEKNIIKQKTLINKSIVAIEINNLNKFLLVEDLPINFIISYGILIGDKTELIEFKLKNKNEIYISDNKIFEIFKQNIDEKSIKKINPKELQKKRCIFHYKRSLIIEELKEYLKTKKKLDLNQIHLMDSNIIENFIPNIKTNHLKIANILKIPVISIFKNSYLKETTINILDYEKQNQIIKPIKTIKQEKIFDFCKFNKNRLYKDVSKEIIIKFDKIKIINKILQTVKTNFDKNKIISQIEELNQQIEISQSSGIIPIPLFKSIETQEYVKIKDKEDFFNLTGVKFELNTEKLKSIYILTIKSKKANFRNKFLKKQLEKTFIELEKKPNKIYFNNIQDLIIKLDYSKIKINEIIKIENISKNHLIELKKILKIIIKKTILNSVKFNKLPFEIIPNTELEKYYFSISNELNQININFNNYPSKKILLKQTITKANKLIQTLKTQEIKERHLYPLSQICLILIKITSKINLKLSNEFEILFKQYFKEIKIDLRKSYIDKNIVELINSITLANKLIRKQKILILKKQEFNSNLLSKNIIITSKIPSIEKKIIKLNYKKIKSIFPYSYNEINKQILNKNPNNIKNETLIIKNKKIPLNNNLYNIKYIYKQLKQLDENKYFIILKKN